MENLEILFRHVANFNTMTELYGWVYDGSLPTFAYLDESGKKVTVEYVSPIPDPPSGPLKWRFVGKLKTFLYPVGPVYLDKLEEIPSSFDYSSFTRDTNA
jgi:hypothetical protein